MHGAGLARALRKLEPEIEIQGFGGSKMAEAGVKVHVNMLEFAFMWFSKVLANLRTIFGLLDKAVDLIDEMKPDAVVLIDYPGFNLSIARKLRKRKICVIYYMAPQIWAWAGWRIRKMRKRISHVLVAMKFEEEYFNSRGLPATYVGHPLFDHLREIEPFEDIRGQLGLKEGEKLLALLPGSRLQEIEAVMPVMLKGYGRLRKNVRNIRVAVAPPNEQYAEVVRSIASNFGMEIDVLPGRAHDLIYSADACLTVSGTVTLEIMHFGKPMVVVYRVNRTGQWLAAMFKKTKMITLVNIIAGRGIVPERLMAADECGWIAGELEKLLLDENARARIISDLQGLAAEIDQPGSVETAARHVLELAREKPLPVQ